MQAGLRELRGEQESLSKKIREKAKEMFNQFSGTVFTAHPKLVGFSWSQYTPHFNDGDECVFGANTGEPHIQFGDEEELDYFSFSTTERVLTGKQVPARFQPFGTSTPRMTDEYKSVPKVHTPEELEKNAAFEAVREFLGNFGNDDFKSMFGDHVEVTVTDKGVSVDGYDHD